MLSSKLTRPAPRVIAAAGRRRALPALASARAPASAGRTAGPIHPAVVSRGSGRRSGTSPSSGSHADHARLVVRRRWRGVSSARSTAGPTVCPMTGEVSPSAARERARRAAQGELRASHADRDRVVEVLRVAAGDGRLTRGGARRAAGGGAHGPDLQRASGPDHRPARRRRPAGQRGGARGQGPRPDRLRQRQPPSATASGSCRSGWRSA